MSDVNTNERILCNDVKCKFKQVNNGLKRKAHECALEKKDAVAFFNKYKCTTCEVGMGEVKVAEKHIDNEMIIKKLKYKGRL